MCPREKYGMMPDTMEMSLWKKIIDDLATHEYEKLIIDTQGFGDPFTDKKLFDRLRYAKKKIPGVQFFTSSNCYRMKPELFPLINKYIDTLRISLYATTPEVYEQMHFHTTHPDFHENFFNEARFNVRSLAEYKTKALKEMNILDKPWMIGQMVVINGINDHQIVGWTDFWEPKLDEIMIWKPHNFGGFFKYRQLDHTKQESCGRPINGPLYVHCDGIVSVCCWDINENLVIGDLNTQTIEEVCHSKAFRMIQWKHRECDFKGIYCWHCEQTNPDPSCLIYSNKNRKLCTMTSDRLDFLEEK